MKHLFVGFETAKLLKDKGFDDVCLAFYNSNGKLIRTTKIKNSYSLAVEVKDKKYTTHCSAPLYQQVIDWLLSKNVFIQLGLDETNGVITFYIQIIKIESFKLFKKQPPKIGTGVKYEEFDITTKEKALNKAIDEALKLI